MQFSLLIKLSGGFSVLYVFFSFYFSLFSTKSRSWRHIWGARLDRTESISFIHHVKLEKRRLTSIYSKSACCVTELCMRICKMSLQKSITIIFHRLSSQSLPASLFLLLIQGIIRCFQSMESEGLGFNSLWGRQIVFLSHAKRL